MTAEANDRHQARECQRCGSVGFDVSDATLNGRNVAFCRDCNNAVFLGEADPEDVLDEIEPDELIPDPELDVDVPVDALDELPRVRREDYEAVVLDGVRPVDRAAERGVSSGGVCNNVANARDDLVDAVEGGA